MSTPISWPPRRSTMKSTLRSGPPRLRFQPRSRPPQIPASMIRLRRNSMFDRRVPALTPSRRYDAYLSEMQSTMKVPSRLAQLPGLPPPPPPPPPPPGGGGGGGGGSLVPTGVLKEPVADHGPVTSPADARTRQKNVVVTRSAAPGVTRVWFDCGEPVSLKTMCVNA